MQRFQARAIQKTPAHVTLQKRMHTVPAKAVPVIWFEKVLRPHRVKRAQGDHTVAGQNG